MDQRRQPAGEDPARARRRIGVVLGLLLAERDRALPYLHEWHRRYHEPRTEGDRSPLTAVPVRARPGPGAGGGAPPRHRVPGRPRPGLRDLAPVRERSLAGDLPLGPDRRAALLPLRRRRVRPGRGRDPGAAARDRRRCRAPGADGPGAPHGPPRRAGAGAHSPPLPRAGPQRAPSRRPASRFRSATRARRRRRCWRAPESWTCWSTRSVAARFSSTVPRLYKLVESGQHEKHELELRFRDDTLAYAFSFAPGPA